MVATGVIPGPLIVSFLVFVLHFECFRLAGMRLFVGVPLPASLVDQIEAFSLRLRSPHDGLRWSIPASWHITLQFLGSAGPELYDCLIARLREVRALPFRIELAEAGFFDRVGIFFVGVSLTPELIAMQARITAATQQCGFAPESRPYRPHITLARSKGKAGAQGLGRLKTGIRKQPLFTPFTATEFLLYESFTRPDGSRYEIRERFSFATS